MELLDIFKVEPKPKSKPKACKYCGESPLFWIELDGKWQLKTGAGEIHLRSTCERQARPYRQKRRQERQEYAEQWDAMLAEFAKVDEQRKEMAQAKVVSLADFRQIRCRGKVGR